jgi:hypothetical protein
MTGLFHSLQRFFRALPHGPHALHVLSEVAAALCLAGIVAWLIARNRRPSAQEVERRRREALAATGRIVDARLIDARTLGGEESTSPAPDVLFYSYRLAGVTYDCAQNVSTLADRVRGYRLDQPVHIRYDPRNPGNSIVVSESWNGLGLAGTPTASTQDE